jgi:hypothetical protein
MFMKAQDLFDYDSAILGLNHLYSEVGEDSFFINSDCILATNKIVTVGKTYALFEYLSGKCVKVTDVRLLDVYYYQDAVHVIVQGILSQQTFTIVLHVDDGEVYCTSIVVDMDYFIDQLNMKAIKQYCGNCKSAEKTNQKPNN